MTKNKKNEMPGFWADNPSTEEEKLIVEISNDLHTSFIASMKLNCNRTDLSVHQLFKISRNSAFAFLANAISSLSGMIARRDQLKPFLDECRKMLDDYLEQIEGLFDDKK